MLISKKYVSLIWIYIYYGPVRQHSFAEIDHEIFSTVILSLLLIQEGKLSVTCERMCTEYWLNA